MKNKWIKICGLSLMLISCLKGTESMLETGARVVEKQNHIEEIIPKIMEEAGLIADAATDTKDGRIATNRIVTTKEGVKYVVRAYPKEMPEKCETGTPLFEIKALNFVKEKGVSSPQLLKFKSGKYYLEIDDLIVTVYPFIEGSLFDKDQLDESTVLVAGNYAKNLVEASVSFKGSDDEFIDEISFILNAYGKRSEEYPQMKSDEVIQRMLEFVKNQDFMGRLADTPRGLVHADFFYENFIVGSDGRGTLIDFGDAYYGFVFLDIALAAMEFSAISEDNWDFKLLSQFLRPLTPWLKQNSIDSQFFIDSMRVLCLKFVCYTVPFTVADKEPLEENPYRKRFLYLGEEIVQNKIESIFE